MSFKAITYLFTKIYITKFYGNIYYKDQTSHHTRADDSHAAPYESKDHPIEDSFLFIYFFF